MHNPTVSCQIPPWITGIETLNKSTRYGCFNKSVSSLWHFRWCRLKLLCISQALKVSHITCTYVRYLILNLSVRSALQILGRFSHQLGNVRRHICAGVVKNLRSLCLRSQFCAILWFTGEFRLYADHFVGFAAS